MIYSPIRRDRFLTKIPKICPFDLLFTPYCVSLRLNSCVVSNEKGFCWIHFGKFQLIQRLNFISSFPSSDVTTEATTNAEGEHLMLSFI